MAGVKSRPRRRPLTCLAVVATLLVVGCGADRSLETDDGLGADGLGADDGLAMSVDDERGIEWWTEIERTNTSARTSIGSESSSTEIDPRDGPIDPGSIDLDSIDLDSIDFEAETWVATGRESDGGVEAWSAFPTAEDLSTHWFPTPTQFGGPRVFLVEGARDGFLHVSLPVQPNGTSGWIRADAVTLEAITVRAEVDLTNHRLTVWDGDEIIVQTEAATGKPSTPTPVGEFFVRDVIPARSSGAYGSYIIGLSGFSETLTSFNGGLPAIAIHGTNRPDLVGREVSNGCVRIPNDLIELLAATVPLGTPVTVVA